MCGYCAEDIMLLNFMEARLSGLKMNAEPIFLPQYLQDYDDLNGIIKDRKLLAPQLPDIEDDVVDILFCRLYDQFVTRGHSGMLFKSLLLTLGNAPVKLFFKRRQHCRDQGFLGSALDVLAMPEIYEDKQAWDKFIEKDMTLTANLEECLSRYFDWWLLGKGRKKAKDGTQELKETGIYDPIINTSKEEGDQFTSMFPGLSFALTFLSRTQSHTEVIKSIALTCPDCCTPYFFGNNLWLQRRAFLTCVKTYGIDFIVTHIDRIRPQLICHALLNTDFPRGEYKRLHMAVLFERERSGEEYAYDGIVRLGKQILGEI